MTPTLEGLKTKTHRKMHRGRFPLYGFILAEFRFNSFRFVSSFKLPFLINEFKKMGKDGFPPYGFRSQHLDVLAVATVAIPRTPVFWSVSEQKSSRRSFRTLS